MKSILFIPLILSALLSSCNSSSTPKHDTKVDNLGAVTVTFAEPHKTLVKLNPGYSWAKVSWATDTLHGGDNIMSNLNNGEDTIGLGYEDNLTVTLDNYTK